MAETTCRNGLHSLIHLTVSNYIPLGVLVPTVHTVVSSIGSPSSYYYTYRGIGVGVSGKINFDCEIL